MASRHHQKVRGSGPGGAVEICIVKAFEVFKGEGAEERSMGLCPLFHSEDFKEGKFEKLLDQVYQRVEDAYDFKALQHSKEKYGSTDWEPRYLVYQDRFNKLGALKNIVDAKFPKRHLIWEELIRRNEKVKS